MIHLLFNGRLSSVAPAKVGHTRQDGPLESRHKHVSPNQMDVSLPLPIAAALIALVAALSASLLTHYLTKKRDRKNEQRRQRATVLLNAFVALLSGSNRPALHEVGPAVERALAEIQALGSAEQVALAQSFASDLVAGKEASMDPLLSNLRSFLRREL